MTASAIMIRPVEILFSARYASKIPPREIAS